MGHTTAHPCARPLRMNTYDAHKRRRLKRILSRIQPPRKLPRQSFSVFVRQKKGGSGRYAHCLTVLTVLTHLASYAVAATSASIGRILTRFLVRLSHSNLTVPSTSAKRV